MKANNITLGLVKGIAIHGVSPIFVTDTARDMGMDTDGTLSAAETVKSYPAAVEGDMTEKILDTRDYGIIVKD